MLPLTPLSLMAGYDPFLEHAAKSSSPNYVTPEVQGNPLYMEHTPQHVSWDYHDGVHSVYNDAYYPRGNSGTKPTVRDRTGNILKVIGWLAIGYIVLNGLSR